MTLSVLLYVIKIKAKRKILLKRFKSGNSSDKHVLTLEGEESGVRVTVRVSKEYI